MNTTGGQSYISISFPRMSILDSTSSPSLFCFSLDRHNFNKENTLSAAAEDGQHRAII